MEEFWTVAAIARQLGIAPGTLRTWDRRYGLGPTEHKEGSHRRYSAEDVARLKLMRRLIINGASVGDAAASVKVSSSGTGTSPGNWDANVAAGEEVVQAAINAAKALDAPYLDELIRRQIKELGVENAWGRFMAPLLLALGSEWVRTGGFIEVEHLASGLIQRALADFASPLPNPINFRPVLIACIENELHVLPALALAATLTQRGIAVNFLGAMTPKEAVFEYVRRSAPPAVMLWAHLPENANKDFIDYFPSMRPAPRILLGGPGWSKQGQPEGALLCGSMDGAIEEMEIAVGSWVN